MRHLLFLALFISCAVALSFGNLLPRSVFRTHAQQQQDTGSSSSPVIVAEQDAGPISAQALQQIQALMEEKASRTPAQKKMSSQLIYAVKMASGQAIANGVSTQSVDIPFGNHGAAIIDITAHVDDHLLARLRQAGATIINSFPQYNSVRVEVNLSAVETIAGLKEVVYVQPMQEATVWQENAPKLQGLSQQGSLPAGSDPEHVRLMGPEFGEQAERALAEHLANAIDDFQLNTYTTGTGGVRKSEADTTHKGNVARNTYGFDGTGVKIGVLSDGVRYLAAAQATGDVGPVTVIPGQSGTSAGQCTPTNSCDEGTAMLELIHDMAPGAQLYFATAFGGNANFANNIRLLRDTYHCDIIVDDVFYFAESPFHDGQTAGVVSPNNQGIVTQAVNDVTADGALYFSSAGNSGNKNDGTSGVWEGDFVDGGATGVPITTRPGRFHQFPADGATPAQNFNVQSAAGGPFSLNWADPLGGSSNDYDLYVLDNTGATVLASSTDTQDGDDDPIEFINASANGPGLRIVVVKFSGAGRFLHLSISRSRLTVNTPGQTSGHSTALNAFGVAATPAQAGGVPAGPFPNPHNSANTVETFSSDGPRKLFFKPDNTPYTPGDFSATGGIVRQKPDITAADRASVTGAGGFPITFSGTSAAAPDAAAIAALLKSANSSLTPAAIRTALNTSAIDIEAAGTDRDSGVGIVMADSAMAAIGAVAGAANVDIGTATVTDVGGNANGFVEPGERATLDIPLLNTGVNPATGVTATLSSTTPGVFITAPATRSYPDIPATNGISSSATPFEFVYQESATYGADIDFVLTVNYNGMTHSRPFKIPTGVLSIISTTLDTTAPPASPPSAPGSNNAYTATTGTQTGRIAFTFPASSCATPKTNPGPFTSSLARRYDAYTYTNSSASPICVTVQFSFSASALLQAVAYVPTFVPATPAVGYAGDNGGSTGQGAGTAQLFSFSVPAGSTFTIVVSETNSGGAGAGVPYTLKVGGFAAAAVPANQPPVNSVPGAQSVLEDSTLTFSAANSNQITVSDPDAGGNPVDVTLSAANGRISLGNTAGLSFTSGDGTADQTMTFTAPIATVNSALNGTTYTPNADFNGADTLTVTTSDKGFTGTGGAQSDSDPITINVTPVNDAPTLDPIGNVTINEDATTQTVNLSGITAGPGETQGLTVTAVSSNPGLIPNPTVTYTSPNTTGSLSFTPVPNANGLAIITVTVTDDGGTANGGLNTFSRSFTVTVNPVNDAPVNIVPGAQTTNQDAPITFSVANSNAISVTDIDTPAGYAVQVILSATNGTLTLSTTSGLTFLTGDGTADQTMTFQGTISNINAALNGLTFIPAPGYNGSASLSITTNDQAVTASNGALSDTDTVAITVQPSIIQLSASSYSAGEGDGRATVTVTRTDGIASSSRIDYATSDTSGLNNCNVVTGNASARCDYTAVGGTLVFLPGEMSKTFTVPFIDDVFVEGPETLTVTLSNPSGAVLGSQTTATLTISDNDTTPGTSNPIDQNSFFIRQLYLDFLNREPDPPGLAAWLQILNNCPAGDTRCDKIEVASAFFRSPESFDRSYFLYKFYEAALGRQPQYDEYQSDLRRLTGFLTAEELEQRKREFAEEFVNRAEFHSIYDSFGSGQPFVDAVLSRAGSARPGVGAATVTTSNRVSVINRLGAGQITRGQALRELMESAEISQRFNNKAFVVVGYFAFLRRNPDAAYLHWIDVLNTTGDYREMIRGFMQSPEFRSRFGAAN